MKAKLLTFTVLICFGLITLVADGYSATAQHKPEIRRVSEEMRMGGPKDESYSAPPKAISKYPIKGINYNLTCTDILPQAGLKIEHAQIGDTWYDFQKNGSMGRMISVTSNGYRHFSWMYTGGVYPGTPRYAYSNCENPAGQYMGAMPADGGATNAGYTNQTHLHTGESVVIYHRTGGTPTWYSALTIEDALCNNTFSRKWDIPDYILNNVSGQGGMWPKAEVLYDAVDSTDYIHVVLTEGNTTAGAPCMVAWSRNYIKKGTGILDTLITQWGNSGSLTYRLVANANGPGSFAAINHFDSSCSVTPVVVVSPVSRRVAIAYLRPADPAGTCDLWMDVCYIESDSNGQDWIDGFHWKPVRHNLTNYGTGGNERAYGDLSACYDYNDSLHIVYVTGGYDNVTHDLYPGQARLYHWSKASGSWMITSKIQEGTKPGAHCLNIAKMSISAKDPIYHPGDDTVFLFCIWTQFDSADNAANTYSNGDLFVCGSFDGGATWGQAFNLTNTQTPGCAAGTCVSEHWSSLAQNMYDGDLHIQYICDTDAGAAIQDVGTAWLDNPVMYLRLTPWEPNPPCCCVGRIDSPDHWYKPPLKVSPNGYRTLILKIFNIGYSKCIYCVNGDNPYIHTNVSCDTLTPRDSATVTIVVSGAGASFIDGNVILHTNNWGGEDYYLPVQAVVANDYYECPYDPLTKDTLENGVLRFYTNANCEEWIHDIGTRPDTVYEVFWTGGTIVATTSGTDTLVGRYMGNNDQHALAGDKLYTDECDVDWEPDFYMVYTKDIFIHDLNPPVDPKWWWWEMSKQIKFFKSTAPDVYKHLVIKYITVKRHNPPIWWPSQPPFTGYDDTYIGVAMDIDCPYDTFRYENARNRAGYDAGRNIAWQRGWDYTGANPQYNNYYAGIALANGGMPGESTVPYGAYNVKSHTHLYPQSPWGWLDGDLYRLAATPLPAVIESPDSIVDRTQVLTARKINAGSDPNASYSFTVVEVVAPGGLTQLQQYVDTARAIVNQEKLKGYPMLCGDLNGDGKIDVGDIVVLLNYLFKGYPISTIACPAQNRADCSGDGLIEVGDVVTLLNYVFKGAPASTLECPGIWGP